MISRLFLSLPALAHHNPGHGASEGLRTLNALGGNLVPRNRAALLLDAMRTTSEPTLNTATIYSASALLSVRAASRWYVGMDTPYVLLDEDSSNQMKSGLGDIRLDSQWLIGSLDGDKAGRYALGLSVTMPTRTLRFESDPGRQWVVSPMFRYSQAWERLSWFALVLLPLETRPAGVAADVSAALGVGFRVAPLLSLGLSGNADVRLLSWCREGGRTTFCRQGRASEMDRPLGATRLYGRFAATFDVSSNWSVFASAQLPLTAQRDVEWSANLGVEWRF